MYARDVNADGAKQFMVQTHAGMALHDLPVPAEQHREGAMAKRHRLEPPHYYEVILAGKPCWTRA